jgi:hypothetical protein
MKGSRAQEEVEAAHGMLASNKLSAEIRLCGVGIVEPATTVVVVDKARSAMSGKGSDARNIPGGDDV